MTPHLSASVDVAGMILTTEALITEQPEKTPAPMPNMDAMDDY